MYGFRWSLLAFVAEISTVKHWSRLKAHRRRLRPIIHRPRVLEGWPDRDDNYPFIIAFIREDSEGELSRSCTGSLITQQWVLTAAHCVDEEIRFIRCGNMKANFTESNCKAKVLKMFKFPSYLGNTKLEHDIALALTDGVEVTIVGKIHSADYKTLVGRPVRYAGFGASYPSYKYSKIGEDKARYLDEHRELQVGEGVIFNGDDISSENGVPKLSIAPKCSNFRQTPYFGDSGGPLLLDGKIVGVLSSRDWDHTELDHYENEKHPELNYYTPVSPYIGWMKQTMISNKI